MTGKSVQGGRARALLLDRGVNAKIVTAVAIAALVAGAVGIMGIRALGATNTATVAMYEQNFQSLDQAAKMRRLFYQLRLDVANHAISADRASKDKYAGKISSTEDEMATAINTY